MRASFKLTPLALATLVAFGAQAAETKWVSTTATGASLDKAAYEPSLSGQGDLVAFKSTTKSISSLANGYAQIYLKNVATGAVRLLTTGTDGKAGSAHSAHPRLSRDGKWLVFSSNANNLVSDAISGKGDIYLVEIASGKISLVSGGLGGAAPQGFSSVPEISADGRYIAFTSSAANLAQGDSNNWVDVFVYDRVLGTTQLISKTTAGANGSSPMVSISGSGRFVAYATFASNLVSGDGNSSLDIHVHDRELGSTERVSVDSLGALGNSHSAQPSISDDGRFIAFASLATNLDLDTADDNGVMDVYLHDRKYGTTRRISVNSAGVGSNGMSSQPVISANGRFTAFLSNATNLDGNSSGKMQMFVYDRITGETKAVSLNTQLQQANADLDQAIAHARNGELFAFATMANNLNGNDTNGLADVYLHQRDPVANLLPVAYAGADQSEVCVNGSAGFQLDGSPSYDPEEEPLTYLWQGPFGKITTASASVQLPFGAHTATLTVEDARGGQAQDDVLLNVTDNSAPILNAKALVTLEASDSRGAVYAPQYSASDSCSTVNVSHSPNQSFYALGETAITITASDAAGNRSSQSQKIAVVDTTAPQITAPADVVAEATGVLTNVALGQAQASDLFLRSVSHDAPSGGFTLGETVVTWRAEDSSGNSSADTQRVVVQDTIAPVINAPLEVTLEATSIDGVDYVLPLDISDSCDCGPLDIVVTPERSVFPLGTTVVQISATDQSGNLSQHDMNITVQDTTAPQLTVPADIRVEANGELSSVDLGDAWTDDIFPVTLSHDAPAAFAIGETIVTWRAEDANGNVTEAKQRVFVEDTTAPQLLAPAALTVEATGKLTSVALGAPEVSDIFATEVSHDAPAAGFPLGETLVTWTAVDANGNRSTATQRVLVADTIAPVIQHSGDAMLEATSANGANHTIQYSASDSCNCGEIKLEVSPQLSVYPLGATTVTLRATDQSGNVASSQLIVTVVDTTAPEMQAPADMTVEASGQLTPVTIGQAQVSDFFQYKIWNDAPSTFPLGTTVVNWYAADVNGNQTQGQQRVTVVDTTAPEFTLEVLQDELRGRRHKMVHAASVHSVSDLVTDAPNVEITISSNGDDHKHRHKWHDEDWEVVAKDGVWEIWLRAERLHRHREDRIYTIDVQVSDEAGNVASDQAEVIVPKKRRHRGEASRHKHDESKHRAERGRDHKTDKDKSQQRRRSKDRG